MIQQNREQEWESSMDTAITKLEKNFFKQSDRTGNIPVFVSSVFNLRFSVSDRPCPAPSAKLTGGYDDGFSPQGKLQDRLSASLSTPI